MTFQSKRLSTDAEIKLRNAGYVVARVESEQLSPKFPYSRKTPAALSVYDVSSHRQFVLEIVGGCVDNERVKKLLLEAECESLFAGGRPLL